MKMRIVGLNGNRIFVQKMIRHNEWMQKPMRFDDFRTMMKECYPGYYQEYLESGTDKKIQDYFWHYGETEEMRRNGDAYIFE